MMTRAHIFFLALFALSLSGVALGQDTGNPPEHLIVENLDGQSGGRLVVALRSEPRTFNPAMAFDNLSLAVLRRLHADLVETHHDDQKHAPGLAKSWEISPDLRRFRLELRRGLVFSDGESFDADDVVFTFKVLLDPEVAAPARSLLVTGEEAPRVRKLGSHEVEIVFPVPYVVGAKLFEDLLILPEHRLGEAYREGRLRELWGLGTEPEAMAGLGPFRLRRHLPGERLELERNPHYWKVDARGRKLPYLDELIFVFVPDEDNRVLRLRSGEVDLLDHLSPDSYAELERRSAEGGLELRDLGPSLTFNFLFFNLNDLEGRGLAKTERRQRWFRDLAFRRAVSLGIDRRAIARLAYRGKATPIGTPVSPSNTYWHHRGLSPPPHSPEVARRELEKAGYRWNGEGELIDGEGRAVEFTLVTNASNRERVETAAIVEEDLKRLGMAVRVVPLEFRALVTRLTQSLDYEACILGLDGADFDPNPGLSVWLSESPNHLWHPAQSEPATPWEAEIDRLMRAQMIEADRKKRKATYDRVQEILAENLPMIFLVSPHALVAVRSGLGHFRPAVLEHPTLWNAEELHWRGDRPEKRP